MSATHEFKFEAPDGKRRKADVLDAGGVQMLAKHYPGNRAHAFLDWFTYSDNSIDGQSRDFRIFEEFAFYMMTQASQARSSTLC